MEISTSTKKMAIIGDPVAHSLSPFMHNNIAEANGLNCLYFPALVRGDQTADFCKAARLIKIDGFNATMPHKNNLLDIVDEIDPEAEAYGAINTVKLLPDGRLKGFNTDIPGLLMAWKGQGVKLEGARIMIIGAGGVAGALVKGCGGENVGAVTVLNRTYAKAAALCEGLSYASAMEMNPENLRAAASEADIIVNCTSLGMAETGSDFEDLTFLDGTEALLCDLIYNPWETSFLRYGRERGLKTINGMDMLIYQGVLAFEIFMDVRLDYIKEHDRLLPLCKEKLLCE